MFSGKKINTQSDSLLDAVNLKGNKNKISDITLKKLLIILYSEVSEINGHKLRFTSRRYSVKAYVSDLKKTIENAISHILECNCNLEVINKSQQNNIESNIINMYKKNIFLNSKSALKQHKNFSNDLRRKEFIIFLEQCIQNIEGNINSVMQKLVRSFRYMSFDGERVEVSAATAIYGSLESLLTKNIKGILDKIVANNVITGRTGNIDNNLPVDVVKRKLQKLLNPSSPLQNLQDEMALMDQAMDYARDNNIAIGQVVTFYSQRCTDGTTDYYTKEMCIKEKAKMDEPVKVTILNENDYNNKAKELSEKFQRLQRDM